MSSSDSGYFQIPLTKLKIAKKVDFLASCSICRFAITAL